jgi:hypothetical protein
MASSKLVVACGLTAVSLSACGIAAKPTAGTLHLDRAPGNHSQLDDPRKTHAKCMRLAGLPITEFRESLHATPGLTPVAGTVPQVNSLPAIQVGTAPTGPTVVFLATPGGAQYAQIDGYAQGAEVIGGALVYPNQASDQELATVEGCTALGVTG